MGKVWGGFGEAFGLILDSKMTLGDQSGAGMFKKCLGTFVGSFELMFLDVWGRCSKATGHNEVGPADRAQRLNPPHPDLRDVVGVRDHNLESNLNPLALAIGRRALRWAEFLMLTFFECTPFLQLFRPDASPNLNPEL